MRAVCPMSTAPAGVRAADLHIVGCSHRSMRQCRRFESAGGAWTDPPGGLSAFETNDCAPDPAACSKGWLSGVRRSGGVTLPRSSESNLARPLTTCGLDYIVAQMGSAYRLVQLISWPTMTRERPECHKTSNQTLMAC
jgi:hypothetical protein